MLQKRLIQTCWDNPGPEAEEGEVSCGKKGGRSSLRTKSDVPSSDERLPNYHSSAPTSTSRLKACSSYPVTNHTHGSMRKQVLTVTQPSVLSQKSILMSLLGNWYGGGAWNMQLVRGLEVPASSSWNHSILQPRALAWWYQAVIQLLHGIQSLSGVIVWAEVNYERKHQLLNRLCWPEQKFRKDWNCWRNPKCHSPAASNIFHSAFPR